MGLPGVGLISKVVKKFRDILGPDRDSSDTDSHTIQSSLSSTTPNYQQQGHSVGVQMSLKGPKADQKRKDKKKFEEARKYHESHD